MKPTAKKILNKILIILLFISLFSFGFVSEILAAEWIMYSESSDGGNYYDIENVRMSPNQVASVWLKTFARNEMEKNEKINTIRNLGTYTAKYNEWQSTLDLYQLDCVNKKVSWKAGYEYSEKGNVLDSSESGKNARWRIIVPESVMESLFRDV